MANAGTINVNLVAEYTAFVEGMNKAADSVAIVQGAVSKATEILGLFGVALGAKEIIDYTAAVLEHVDAQAKLADRLGMTTESLTELEYAGQSMGIQADTLTDAFSKMEVNLGKMSQGGTAAGAAFSLLKVNLSDLVGSSPDQQFLKVATAISQLGTSSERSSAAVAIFGKAGAQLLPLLDQGGTGIHELMEEADQLGITFSRLDAAKVEVAEESFTRLKATMSGMMTAIIIPLAPLLQKLADDLFLMAKNSDGFRTVGVDAFNQVREKAGDLLDVFNGIRAVLNSVAAVAWEVAASFWALAHDVGVVAVNVGQSFGIIGKDAYLVSALIGDYFKVAWAGIELGVSQLVTYITENLGNAAEWVGKKLSWVPGVGQAIAVAGTFVANTSVTMVKSLQDSFAIAKADAKEMQKELSDGFSNPFKTMGSDNNPMVQMMHNAVTYADAKAEEAAQGFVHAFVSVLGSTGTSAVNAWFAQATQSSAAMAGDKAAKAAANAADEAQARQYAATMLAIQDQLRSQDIAHFKQYLSQEALDEDNRYADQIKRLKEAEQRKQITTGEYNAMAKAAEEEHQSNITNIGKTEAQKQLDFDKQTAAQKLEFTAGMLGNLATLMQSHSRSAFEVGKAAAYAQAIMTTAAGISRQFSDLPLFLAIPAATTVAVAGAAQIATIAGTSFGGGGSSPSVGGSGGSGSGSTAAASTPATTTPAAPPAAIVTINGLNDDMLYSGGAIRALIDAINLQGQDGPGVANLVAA